MKNWRAYSIFIFFLIFSAVIFGRLIYIQILHGEFYKALSQGFRSFSSGAHSERGEIYFKDGEPLAINKDFSLVFATPSKIKEAEKTSDALSGILNLDKELILEALKKDVLFSPIKEKLSEEEIKNLENLNLEGINITKETGRYYPQEDLASQLVGFVDADGKGQYGLEGYYDDILNSDGLKGSDLILTIDYNIQFEAEKLLKSAKENLKIEGGHILVIEPNSGKILALANSPNFNPNQYKEYAASGDLDIFKNGASQEIFEPGSVFKPFTMAAALNEGKITPQATYVDEGKIKIGGYVIYNYDGRVYGQKTMTEVLEMSINTGAVFAGNQISHETFLDYISKFGIFKPTGIDIPEVYSENREFKKGYEINFATASFGQGIEMTLVQLAKAYCTIANGGKPVKPYLVEEAVKNSKKTETQPEISSAIISQKTSSQLAAMLISVVENGYAKSAKIPGYYIAGKTGTAQIPWGALGIVKSGYSDKTWQSFVGFAPAFNPRFLILIKLDNPQTKTAEYSAVPIFHDLAEYIINYWQIPPDYK